MTIHTLTIVGVGLIGGSIALAAKKRGLARKVRGVGRRQASLDHCLALGVVDETSTDLAASASQTEVIVLCTPVDRIAEQVLTLAAHCSPGTLITDAGSTKAGIVRALEGRLPDGVHFVGSHPLAGSEKRGPEHARADLFEDRWTIVTPTPNTDGAAVDRVVAFWKQLGSRVRLLDPEEHDRALAMTSHLPHLVAAALAAMLPDELRELTAGGFRDTTRIAAGDPELWTAIFRENRQAVLAALGPFESQLRRFRQALEDQDWPAAHALLTQAKKVRDALGS